MRANWILVGLALGAGVGIGLLARPARQGQEIPDTGTGQHSTSPIRTKSSTRFASAESSPPPRERISSLSSIEGEARRLGITPDPQNSADALELYTEWAQNDPYSAIAQAIDLGEAGGHLRHRVMQVWARQDPVAAAQFFSANRSAFIQIGPQGGTFGNLGTPAAAARAIAAEWAATDPEAALAWAKTLPPEDHALRSAIGAITERSPTAATDAFALLPAEVQVPCANEVAKSWAKQNYADAKAWIDRLPAGNQEEARLHALQGLIESNPKAAAQELTAQTSPSLQHNLATSLARTWAQQDPRAAAEWLRTPASQSVQSLAAGPVVEALTRKDAQAAWQLVQGMAGSDAYDPSLAAYIRTQSQDSPDRLLELTNGIRDDATRGQTIALIMSRQPASDPQAASSFGSDTPTK